MTPKRSLGTVEILRIVAIIGVIWFHVPGLPAKRVAYAGLIVFVILTAAFAAQSSASSTWNRFLRKRVQRLLLPWVAWSLLYGLLNLSIGRPAWPHASDLISATLAGPWIGLWYLPFAFVVSVVAFGTRPLLIKLPLNLAYIIGTGLTLLLLFLAGWLRETQHLGAPWAQWLHALPGVPLGILLSVWAVHPIQWSSFLAFAAAPLMYGAITRFSDPGLAVCYLISTPLVALSFMSAATIPDSITRIANLSMGVYVLHGCIISFSTKVPIVASSPYTVFLLTVLLSYLVAFLVKKIPLTAKLV